MYAHTSCLAGEFSVRTAHEELWEVLRLGAAGWEFLRDHWVGGSRVDFYAPALRLAVTLYASESPLERFELQAQFAAAGIHLLTLHAPATAANPWQAASRIRRFAQRVASKQ